MKKFWFSFLTVCLTASAAFAGEVSRTFDINKKDSTNLTVPAVKTGKEFFVDFGVDVMSSYVCRGSYQTSASFQPKFAIGYYGFAVEAWGSTDFGREMYELDLGLTYTYKGLKVSLTDLYVVGKKPFWGTDNPESPGAPIQGFFNTDARTTPHVVEAAIRWSVSEKVPITLQWGTMVFGNDFREIDGKRNFTSYFEVFYPFTVLDFVDLQAGVGGVPYATKLFGYDGFAITNVYLHAKKMWDIKNIRLGVLARLICNPARQEMNFVGCIAFAI